MPTDTLTDELKANIVAMPRDIYNDPDLQRSAWEFCQTWPDHILDHLIGEDSQGKSCSLQNIEDMLNDVEDLGEFTTKEWILFFQIVRVEGI